MPQTSAPSTARVAKAPFRPVNIGSNRALVERGTDGTILVRSPLRLPDFPRRLTERLVHFAEAVPERTFIAERGEDGGWIEWRYAATLAAVRRIGAALLARDLSIDRPVAILSGNSVDHALLGLACLHVGIPYAPISPAYSLASADFAKLKHVLGLLTPGLVYAADGRGMAAAIAAAVPADAEIVASDGSPTGRTATAFSELAATLPSPEVEKAFARVGPDTIAKFLFTSGSTGLPKAVINTQRMLASNQVMLRQSLAVLQDEPPVIVDWLPWNHTFGGNHNVGLVLFNGGTMFLDAGKPTPAGIWETVRNLKEIAPTIYFNVPKGFEELIPHFRRDPDLRRLFFSRLKLNFVAGAGLLQPAWDALDEIAVEETGERIDMLTGLGATESAPFAMVCDPHHCRAGYVGLPAVGVDLKLVPVGGKLEARLKGPSITPGYWRDPANTARAFDADGWYCLGDALRFVDEADLAKGFKFDGRITEDFKLSSGTWVSVGPLRARLIAGLDPLVRDVVIAGLNEDEVTALLIADVDGCRNLCPGLDGRASLETILDAASVRAAIAGRLAAIAKESPGSSTRVARALFLDAPLSIDAGEITDKGSINQRAVLANRGALVRALYEKPYSPRVIAIAGDGD